MDAYKRSVCLSVPRRGVLNRLWLRDFRPRDLTIPKRPCRAFKIWPIFGVPKRRPYPMPSRFGAGASDKKSYDFEWLDGRDERLSGWRLNERDRHDNPTAKRSVFLRLFQIKKPVANNPNVRPPTITPSRAIIMQAGSKRRGYERLSLIHSL